MSWWNAKYKNNHGEYEITFASKSYDKAKAVEKICQAVIDKRVKSKEDVEAVVRCKDCAVPHNKWTGCPKLNGLVPPPDFYCSFGERKDNV